MTVEESKRDIKDLLDLQGRVVAVEKDVQNHQLLFSQNVSDINRRLESMQQNNSVRDDAILKKIEATIKISLLEFEKSVDSKLKTVDDAVTKNSNDINFTKKLGYGFAAFVGLTGWDRFTTIIKNLIS